MVLADTFDAHIWSYLCAEFKQQDPRWLAGGGTWIRNLVIATRWILDIVTCGTWYCSQCILGHIDLDSRSILCHFPCGDTSCADFVASSHFVFPPILDLFGQCRNTGGAEVKVDPTQSDPQLTYCG